MVYDVAQVVSANLLDPSSHKCQWNTRYPVDKDIFNFFKYGKKLVVYTNELHQIWFSRWIIMAGNTVHWLHLLTIKNRSLAGKKQAKYGQKE